MGKYNDEEFKKIFKSKIIIPDGYRRAVDTAFESRIKKNSVFKILATSCISLLITTGIAFAGYNICQNIWKEPDKITTNEVKEMFENKEVSKEEKEKLITPADAENKTLEIFNKLGYLDFNVEKTELKNTNNKKYYEITLSGNNKYIAIIDASTCKLKGINNFNNNFNNINQITEEKAKEDINYICNCIDADVNEYELRFLKEDYNYFGNNKNKVWVASYNKKYDTRFDPYDSIKISFYERNNTIQIQTILIEEDDFSNNEIVITKEDAEKIALEKEREFSQLEIIEKDTEIQIRKINTYIYKLENNIADENIDESNENTTIYKVDDIVRNVWVVRIKHKQDENIKFDNSIDYNKQMDKKYYIDATTGEIVGGENLYEKTNNLLYN